MGKQDAERFIFIDESGVHLGMHRAYGRIEGGQRIKWAVPYPRKKRYSVISAIGLDEIKTSLYGDWSTDGAIFLTFIRDCLCPKLVRGDTVLMDNVAFHKSKQVRTLIEKTGAHLLFLPPYSPDFSPIEMMWSKIKSVLKKQMPRTEREFRKSIKKAFLEVTQNDLFAWFKHCGYKVSTI